MNAMDTIRSVMGSWACLSPVMFRNLQQTHPGGVVKEAKMPLSSSQPRRCCGKMMGVVRTEKSPLNSGPCRGCSRQMIIEQLIDSKNMLRHGYDSKFAANGISRRSDGGENATTIRPMLQMQWKRDQSSVRSSQMSLNTYATGNLLKRISRRCDRRKCH